MDINALLASPEGKSLEFKRTEPGIEPSVVVAFVTIMPSGLMHNSLRVSESRRAECGSRIRPELQSATYLVTATRRQNWDLRRWRLYSSASYSR